MGELNILTLLYQNLCAGNHVLYVDKMRSVGTPTGGGREGIRGRRRSKCHCIKDFPFTQKRIITRLSTAYIHTHTCLQADTHTRARQHVRHRHQNIIHFLYNKKRRKLHFFKTESDLNKSFSDVYNGGGGAHIRTAPP